MSLSELKIESCSKSTLLLKLVLSKSLECLDLLFHETTKEDKLEFLVKFLHREQREQFCVLHELFQIIKILPFIKRIEKYETVQQDQKIFNNNQNHSMGDMLLLIQNIKKTLHQTILYTIKVIFEKESLEEYVENLETDLKQIIKDFKEEQSKKNLTNMNISKIDLLE